MAADGPMTNAPPCNGHLTFAQPRFSTLPMRIRLALAPLLAMATLALLPSRAAAQYKNSSFGLDIGGWMITKPTVIDPATKTVLTALDKRPLRLTGGVRLGGETNLKIDSDRLWFTGRVNAGFLGFPSGAVAGTPEQQFDYQANQTLGTIFAVEGSIGLRYVFLTNRVRPYLQGALSYVRLMTFASQASEDCVDQTLCGGTDTNQSEYLPHPNVGLLHIQPGVELLWARDIGVNLFVDLQRWLIYNAADNNAVVIGVGLVFFT